MKNLLHISIAASMVILLCSTSVFAQDEPILPFIIKTGDYLGLSAPIHGETPHLFLALNYAQEKC